MEYELFQNLIYVWMALGAVIFLVLLKITAPYGRHTTTGWGPLMSNRLGWVFMEVPGIVLLVYFLATHLSELNAITLVLPGLYIFHYFNRTFIFPFRLHTKGKKMPVLIVGSGFAFNLVNGFFLGYYFVQFAAYDNSYFYSLNFGVGLLLFVLGVVINWRYDNKLIHLRRSTDTGYVIPQKGLFNYVSCPNLLGEIIEWTGFAIICWNLPAASFLVWTLANLVPRAISHHKWYKQKFDNYPPERKALFPFVV